MGEEITTALIGIAFVVAMGASVFWAMLNLGWVGGVVAYGVFVVLYALLLGDPSWMPLPDPPTD
jgi:hypothetical protein